MRRPSTCGAKLMAGKSDTLIKDAMIAATARVHLLTVVTRNTRNFTVFGVLMLDPFDVVARCATPGRQGRRRLHP